MELGSLELQIFVSLVVVLGAAFVALVCDFLKGNNEQLRERNIELRVRQDERERMGLFENPLSWLQGLASLAKNPKLAETFGGAGAAADAAPAAEAAPAQPAAAAARAAQPMQPETNLADLTSGPAAGAAAAEAAAAATSSPTPPRRRMYDEFKAQSRTSSWATKEELEQLAGRAARIRARHEAAQQESVRKLTDMQGSEAETEDIRESSLAKTPVPMPAAKTEPQETEPLKPVLVQTRTEPAPEVPEARYEQPQAATEPISEPVAETVVRSTVEPATAEEPTKPAERVSDEEVVASEPRTVAQRVEAEKKLTEESIVSRWRESWQKGRKWETPRPMPAVTPEAAAAAQETKPERRWVFRPSSEATPLAPSAPALQVPGAESAGQPEDVVSEVSPVGVADAATVESESTVAAEPAAEHASDAIAANEPVAAETTPIAEVFEEPRTRIQELHLAAPQPVEQAEPVKAEEPTPVPASIFMPPVAAVAAPPAVESAEKLLSTLDVAALGKAAGEAVPASPILGSVGETGTLDIPSGLHEAAVLTRLLQNQAPFSGVVVAIGINDFDTLREKLAIGASNDSVAALNKMVMSMLRPQDFACRFVEDEFVLIYPEESGSSAQRRLFQVSEKLWDFQLRSLGHLSVMFSWGGLEVTNEPLSEAVSSARERMYQTKRNRKPATLDFTLGRKKVVNG